MSLVSSGSALASRSFSEDKRKLFAICSVRSSLVGGLVYLSLDSFPGIPLDGDLRAHGQRICVCLVVGCFLDGVEVLFFFLGPKKEKEKWMIESRKGLGVCVCTPEPHRVRISIFFEEDGVLFFTSFFFFLLFFFLACSVPRESFRSVRKSCIPSRSTKST